MVGADQPVDLLSVDLKSGGSRGCRIVRATRKIASRDETLASGPRLFQRLQHMKHSEEFKKLAADAPGLTRKTASSSSSTRENGAWCSIRRRLGSGADLQAREQSASTSGIIGALGVTSSPNCVSYCSRPTSRQRPSFLAVKYGSCL